MRKFAIVTTFNQSGLDKYAQRMINSFQKNWPTEVTLYVYAEDCNPIINNENVVLIDLHQTVEELVQFKNKWKDTPKANGDISNDPVKRKRNDWNKKFKWDAVRFSHKVYSIFHCATICEADVLVWMDADMYCHSPVTMDILNRLIPEDIDLGYLGREKKWPECGFYSLNLHSEETQIFLTKFKHAYNDAENGIFQMDEWHDSFVFEEVRKTCNLKELNWSEGLVKGEGHPLINSEWGAYLDHLKGDRKTLGKSKATDLLKPRKEEYWK